MHRLAVAKAHFGLGRVHIDVDTCRRQGKEQGVAGLAVAMEHVGIGGAHRVLQHLVAHEAAIDEEVLRVPRGFGCGRIANQAGQRELVRRAARSNINHSRGSRELIAQHTGDALRARLIFQMQADAAIVGEGDADIGTRKRDLAYRFRTMSELGAFALQKLAPRGHAAKQFVNLYHGALRQRRRTRAGIACPEGKGIGAAVTAAGEREARH